MAERNVLLETKIIKCVTEHPGRMRRQYGRELQREGIGLGLQHISNRAGELVEKGMIREEITDDGRRLLYPKVTA
ncbi:MAG: hypothetical protein NTV84_00955 [Methanoregula sp.]|nr:hypothetical protein [Methanoregula sp.]